MRVDHQIDVIGRNSKILQPLGQPSRRALQSPVFRSPLIELGSQSVIDQNSLIFRSHQQTGETLRDQAAFVGLDDATEKRSRHQAKRPPWIYPDEAVAYQMDFQITDNDGRSL
jgi:hypothetical protein